VWPGVGAFRGEKLAFMPLAAQTRHDNFPSLSQHMLLNPWRYALAQSSVICRAKK
jgi:hypothetical protein